VSSARGARAGDELLELRRQLVDELDAGLGR
jgi:hypothetical protein